MFNKTDVEFFCYESERISQWSTIFCGSLESENEWIHMNWYYPWICGACRDGILTQYKKWIGIFRPANIAEYDDIPVNDRAKTVLRDRLKNIIAGGNIADEANVKTVNIVDDVLSYITDTIAPMKNPKEQEAQLRLFLRNYGNILKITPENIAHDKELLKKDESYIRNLTDTFVGMYSRIS